MPRAAAGAYKGVMDAPSYLVGQFLLAMPGIGDPRFEKAVVAMCVHDEAGALGIGLGELVPRLRLHDLLAQLDIPAGEAPNAPIHHGGPVEPQRGFILHTPDWGGQDSIEVAGRWVLSATLDVLRAIAEGKGPSRWVVALGYAGWGPGQLDAEMQRHGWFVTDGSDALLYDEDVETRWAAAFRGAGVDPRLLAAHSGTA
ncbi:YqgE/AlgH family protein [Sphingosinicella ginsenosidimutans]